MKIVIIVLVLVAVIFVILVLTGAFRSEPKNKNSNQAATEFTKNPPAWTKAIKRFIGSRQPKLKLERDRYTGAIEEKIPPDDKNPFRTAKLRAKPGGVAIIEYVDNTENLPKDMKDLKEQKFRLPDFDNKEPFTNSIVALKRGGTLTIRCEGTTPCQVDVEK